MLEIQITDTPNQLKVKIEGVLNKMIRQVLSGRTPSDILERIKPLIISNIRASKEFQDIVGGDLRGELGVPEPEPLLQHLIDILISNIEYKIQDNHLQIVLLRPGYEEVADQPIFKIENEGKAGGLLPWLKWMLTAGDQIIIQDHYVKFGNYTNQSSRTGIAIMLEKTGTFWRVPPEYHNFIDKNFITESISSLEPYFYNIVTTEITDAFGRL